MSIVLGGTVVAMMLAVACASPRRVQVVMLPSATLAAGVASASLPTTRTTGPLILGANHVAYVADEDPPSVRAFDVGASRELWATPLEGTPGHLALAADGRVFVAVRGLDRIELIVPQGALQQAPVKTLFVPKVCTEPVGVTLSTDESTLLVACGWAHQLVAVSVQDARIAWRVDLPLEPRAVMATPDGKQAIVSHAVGGRLSVVDLPNRQLTAMELRGSLVGRARTPNSNSFGPTLTGASMMTSNGFALAEYDGIVYASVTSSLTDRGPNVSNVYYGSSIDEGVVFPIVASEAPKSKFLYGRVSSRLASGLQTQEIKGCLAPRGVAIRPTTWSSPDTSSGAASTNAKAKAKARDRENNTRPSTRLVACPGNDSILEHDETGEAIRRILVPGGPSAIVLDTQNDMAIVWSQSSRHLSTIDLRSGSITAGVAAVERSSDTPIQLRLGKRLFERVDDPRISGSGRGCASCHPDGRADALTWGTPEGPRQTMMLAGRLAGTAPYGWTRGSKTLHGYVSETVRRLGGSGLPKSDMDALIAYVSSLRVPDAATFVEPVTTIAAKRGKSIFESREAQCSMCHSGPQLTDGTGHSVTGDTAHEGNLFDTPSLRFIGHTAPYFHDGRYASLRQLLGDIDGKMGKTKHLTPNDLDALEAYLQTL